MGLVLSVNFSVGRSPSSKDTQKFRQILVIVELYAGKRIKIIKYIDWEDVEEPCKGDTPA